MKQVIKWELYKILIAKFGVIFIFIYFVLQIVLGINNNYKLENRLSPTTQKHMDSYYEEFGGKLDEAKCENIEKKKSAIDSAVALQKEARIKFESGSITESDLNSIIASTFSTVSEKKAFEEFYKKYNYSKVDLNKRFLINTSSWEILLDVDSPDFITPLLLITLIAFSYIDDVKKKSIEIIKNTRIGFRKLVWCKLISFIIIVIAIGFLEQLGKIIVSINACPLENFNAPIQSLHIFSDSNYNISLLQTFVLGSLIKIWGLIYLIIITNMAILLLNNAMLGIFSSSVIFALPYFLFSKDNLYLSLPLPIGFLQQNIFFVCNNKPNNWIFTSRGLLLLLLSTFIISSVLTLTSYHCYKKNYR